MIGQVCGHCTGDEAVGAIDGDAHQEHQQNVQEFAVASKSVVHHEQRDGDEVHAERGGSPLADPIADQPCQDRAKYPAHVVYRAEVAGRACRVAVGMDNIIRYVYISMYIYVHSTLCIHEVNACKHFSRLTHIRVYET